MSEQSASKLIFFDHNAAEFSEYPTLIEKCVKGQARQRTWHHFTSHPEAGDAKLCLFPVGQLCYDCDCLKISKQEKVAF